MRGVLTLSTASQMIDVTMNRCGEPPRPKERGGGQIILKLSKTLTDLMFSSNLLIYEKYIVCGVVNMSSREISQESFVLHSLKILAELSCISQVKRYEYYSSKNEYDKAVRYIESVIKSLISSREILENIVIESRELSKRTRDLRGVLEEPYLRDLMNFISKTLRRLEEIPEEARGCVRVKAHLESIVYVISNLAERIYRERSEKQYISDLEKYLDYLANYIEGVLRVIPR
ncbi:MAG: hypothetical protein ABWJ42_06245 [Sulfolobales archaeon]